MLLVSICAKKTKSGTNFFKKPSFSEFQMRTLSARQGAALVSHADVVVVAANVVAVVVVVELLRTRLPLVVGLVQRPNELTLVVLRQASDERPRRHDLQNKFTPICT